MYVSGEVVNGNHRINRSSNRTISDQVLRYVPHTSCLALVSFVVHRPLCLPFGGSPFVHPFHPRIGANELTIPLSPPSILVPIIWARFGAIFIPPRLHRNELVISGRVNVKPLSQPCKLHANQIEQSRLHPYAFLVLTSTLGLYL